MEVYIQRIFSCLLNYIVLDELKISIYYVTGTSLLTAVLGTILLAHKAKGNAESIFDC